MNCCIRLSLALQVRNAAWLSHEKPVRNTVGNHAVDLFRHGHIATAQTGFYVRHGNAQLLGYNRAGQCRIYIADHQHRIRPLRVAELLKSQHDLARLLRMATSARRHEDIWLRNAQFLKKNFIHLAIIMLTGMDNLVCQATMGLQCTYDGRNFHEIRARTGNQIKTFHVFVPTDLGEKRRLGAKKPIPMSPAIIII